MDRDIADEIILAMYVSTRLKIMLNACEYEKNGHRSNYSTSRIHKKKSSFNVRMHS